MGSRGIRRVVFWSSCMGSCEGCWKGSLVHWLEMQLGNGWWQKTEKGVVWDYWSNLIL